MTPTVSSPAIATTGLRKSSGDKLVLDGVDLNVTPGSIFSLLGQNGAGETTAVHVLSTLISTDQFSAVDDLLTGEENLILMADLRRLAKTEGRRRAAELLEQFDLVEAGKKLAANYSGGMRRRLDLAMTLVGDPQIIFLDEPMTGLDPRSRHAMWQIIRDMVAGWVTILITTQYLDEADELADRIAVLDGGKLVAEGTADELMPRVLGGRIRLEFADTQSRIRCPHSRPSDQRGRKATAASTSRSRYSCCAPASGSLPLSPAGAHQGQRGAEQVRGTDRPHRAETAAHRGAH